ncbi:MAG: hypothetical protein U0Q16_39060 [Bryobacteraceae bacterium]
MLRIEMSTPQPPPARKAQSPKPADPPKPKVAEVRGEASKPSETKVLRNEDAVFVSLKRQDPEHFRFANSTMVHLYDTGHYAANRAHYENRLQTRQPGTLKEPAKPAPMTPTFPPQPFHDDVTDRSASAWTDLMPEPVAWSKRSGVKHVLTMTAAKNPVEGRIASAHSRIVTYNPVEILIHSADKKSILDYRLVRLSHEGGERKVMLGPVADRKTVLVRESIPFGADWMGETLYKVYFTQPLPPGEYGLFKANEAATAATAAFEIHRKGEIRTFRVVE